MTPWNWFDIEYSICNSCTDENSKCLVVADVDEHHLCAYLSSQPDIIQVILLLLIFLQIFIFFIIFVFCIYKFYQPHVEDKEKKLIESFV